MVISALLHCVQVKKLMRNLKMNELGSWVFDIIYFALEILYMLTKTGLVYGNMIT